MTDNAATAHAGFDEIAAMAKEERKLHPAHDHYLEVDAALNGLRENVRAYLGAAGNALSLGNTSEAEHLRAQAALVIARARPVWAARLDAAKAERERVYGGIQRAQIESRAQMLGVYPPGRGAEVSAAAHALRLRLDALACGLSKGDEEAFASVLDAMDAAAVAFRSAIGIAQRERRLRIASARAEAAVSAVSAEAA